MGCRPFSEEGPDHIFKEASLSENDNIHFGVKQCGDGEGLSMARLQERAQLSLKPSSKCLFAHVTYV